MPMHNWTRVDANFFHDFHVGWIGALRHTLNNGVLPKGYFARAEQVKPPLTPDLLALQIPRIGHDDAHVTRKSTTAVLAPPRAKFTAVATGRTTTKRPERHIAIRDEKGRRLVAIIEVVSRSNKSSDGIGRFKNKVVDLLRNGVHVLVLDCFPPRKRDPYGLHPLVWRRLVGAKKTVSVSTPCMISYAAKEKGEFAFFLEPIAVGDPLAPMPLFLTGKQYVNVPLEETYQYAWSGFGEPDREELESA